jgi:hypothetical protein
MRSDFKNLSTLTNLLFASLTSFDCLVANKPLDSDDVFARILDFPIRAIAVDFADGNSFEGLIILAI